MSDIVSRAKHILTLQQPDSGNHCLMTICYAFGTTVGDLAVHFGMKRMRKLGRRIASKRSRVRTNAAQLGPVMWCEQIMSAHE